MRLPGATCAAAIVATLGPACSGAGEAGSAVAVFPSGAEFQLEIAADAETQRRGYMFREEVGPREGMLFVFPRDERRGFWMKNCRVELDIIWMDRNFRVLEIAHRLPPCPPRGDCPVRAPLRAARHVLEVAGGTARAEGLVEGDRVEILYAADRLR